MNGKIKTKFAALFAVALMITVCVVPMVGGSEDVEAATTETIDISGTVFKADGTAGWNGLEVYVDGTDIVAETDTDGSDNGCFKLEDVPVKDTIIVKVNVGKYLSDGTTNPAYGVSFPDIKLSNATVDQDITIQAGTVKVTGYLFLKGDTSTKVVEADISVSGNGIDTKTDSTGKFEFYGVPGIKYELSASFAGVSFEGSATPVASGALNTLNLNAESYMMKSKVVAPFGSISYTSTTDDIVSFGDLTFNKEVDDYYVYAPLTFNSDGTNSVKFKMVYGYGIKDSDEKTINASGNYTTSIAPSTAPADGYVITGNVTVGTVPVTPTSVKLVSTQTTTTEADYGKSITANIVDGEYFVGNIYNATTSIGNWKLVASATTGYIFNEPTNTTEPITSQNEAKITVNAEVKDKTFTVSGSNVVVAQEGFVTNAAGTFSFYVPLASGNIVITAPDNYSPKTQTISKVYSDMTVEFDYIEKIYYKGEVLLNGVPVSVSTTDIEYATDGESFINDASVEVETPADGTPYYTIALDRDVDVSKMKVKLKANAGGYTFESNVADPSHTVPVGVTGTTIGAFNVKAVEKTATVKSGTMPLPGMEISFVMVKGSTYNESFVVADLGKAVTDAFGVARINAATPVSSSDDYKLFAIPSGECEYGSYASTKAANSFVDSVSITATEKTYSNYYTADGSELKGFGMSFIAKKASEPIAYGDAKIIGNKYYIVAPADTTDVDVKLADGFEIEGQSPVYGYYNISLFNSSSVIEVEPEVEEFEVTLMINSEFSNNVNVSVKDGKYDEGTIIVLSAEKVCYALQNGGLQYDYTDAAVEYKFAGWYVNGKLLTEDCDATIKLSEDIVIVAQYEEAIKVVGSADVPEAGLDTNVLILGIVVVVIALIAVVYSVISKRD